MHHFAYAGGVLHAEECSLEAIAERYGTPAYVYSQATLLRHLRVFDEAFASVDHLVCFAVKSLSNLAVLRLFADRGAGFDIVSGGELRRALLAGGKPDRIVMSGVGKTRAEMDEALEVGIASFHVESWEELEALEDVARARGAEAPISVRVNPDVDAKTHPHIATGLKASKFGVPAAEALRLYERARDSAHLRVEGVACHIGSQITELAPFLQALDRLRDLVADLGRRGIPVRTLDLGGGLGVPYQGETPPTPEAYGRAIVERLAGSGLRLLVEPGRAIAGNAGILLTRVLYRKEHDGKRFVVVDAGMNDAIRPVLYQGQHAILPVRETDAAPVVADIVGPVCESGDFLARDRAIAWPEQGALLAMMTAGAYGMVMASNYNSRPRAPEILVSGTDARLVRRRETFEDLVGPEVDVGAADPPAP
jgi:diaminopimelate decarboxylase